MSDEEFDYIEMGGSQAPYTTMLKELAETVILVSTGVAQCSPTDYSKEMLSRALALLQGELEIQLTYQNDLILELRSRKQKENMKKSNNVVSLKGE